MPTLLNIVKLGDPILRKDTASVNEIDSTLVELAENMIYTCEQLGAVGLAAPQIGQSIRLIVIVSRPTLRQPKAPTFGPIAMFNPIDESEIGRYVGQREPDEYEKGWEGCMSIPGLRGLVNRKKKLEASYTDITGKRNTIPLEGFVARIFQYERDHLDGLFFFDRIKPFSPDLVSEEWYEKEILPGLSAEAQDAAPY